MLRHIGPINGIAVHEDTYIAAGYDNQAILWEKATGKSVAKFRGPNADVLWLNWTQDSQVYSIPAAA